MTTIFNDIRAALDTTLNGLGLPIAWENVLFEPSFDTEFVRPTLLPGESSAAGLGASAQDRQVGIYQVDVFLLAGKSPVSTAPDTIGDAFNRGSLHTFNGTTVRVRSVSQGPAIREKLSSAVGSGASAFYVVPVTINYFAYTAARG
jgi:hypothetical protein